MGRQGSQAAWWVGGWLAKAHRAARTDARVSREAEGGEARCGAQRSSEGLGARRAHTVAREVERGEGGAPPQCAREGGARAWLG